MSIKFTRYHLPNGRQTEEHIDRSAEIERQTQAFVDAGGVFEMEVLRTGEVSFTAEHDNAEDGPVAIRLALNQPGRIGAAVDQLVAAAFARIPALEIDREELSCLDLEDQMAILLGETSEADPF